MAPHVDLLVVGAGPTGCVVAERAAAVLGWRVLVIDRREHVGGNCHDPLHASGVRIHRHGPHCFRTNSRRVVTYLSRFTEWIPADYRARAFVNGALHPFPINLDTMEQFFGRSFTTPSAHAFLAARRIPCDTPRNSEQYLLSRIGPELYRAFYLNYTRKQWGRHPRALDASVCSRVPIRFTRADRYFDHAFQQMPRDGFTAMFGRMLHHPNIEVRLNCAYDEVRESIRPRQATVYGGPLDGFFACRHGRLPWRSLRFDFQDMAREFAQPCMQINYPNDHAYTRCVEIKHVTGQRHPRTVLAYEFPAGTGEPYYPVPGPESAARRAKYQALARQMEARERIFFAGRLATYAYIDMDEAVLQALALFQHKLRPLAGTRARHGRARLATITRSPRAAGVLCDL